MFRKSEATLYPFYSKRKGGPGGVALTRKPSFGSVRPFLHQYEVKGHAARSVSSQPNSAPSTPVKTKESGFKRSLSFGAGVHKKPLLPRTTLPPPQHTFTTPPQKQEGADDQGEAPPTPSATPSSNGKCVLARPRECLSNVWLIVILYYMHPLSSLCSGVWTGGLPARSEGV